MTALKDSFTSTGHTIYTLSDNAGNVRYVGITKRTLAVRLKGHIKQSKRGRTYRDHWIASLGYDPIIASIEEDADSSRESFWIKHYRDAGCRLTNHTDGGEGITGYRHTAATKERLSKAHRGRQKPAEVRANMSAASKEKWKTQEFRAKMRAAQVGHPVSDKVRDQLRARHAAGWNPMRGKKHSEESRAKNRASQLRRSAAGIPGPRKGVTVSEETKAKLREAATRRKASGYVSPLKGKPRSQAVREKLRAAKLAYHARLREEAACETI